MKNDADAQVPVPPEALTQTDGFGRLDSDGIRP